MRAFRNLVKTGKAEGKAAIEPNLEVELWRSHLKYLYSKASDGVVLDREVVAREAVADNIISSTSAPPCTMKEVTAALGNLLAAKAPGLDRIPGDLFRSEQAVWAPYLWILFNAILHGMVLPPTWAGAEIIPIFKKGSPLDPVNYRPISLIDVTQKIFARVLVWLQSWMEEHNVLTPYKLVLGQKLQLLTRSLDCN